MNRIIPIVFSTDDNYVLPLAVAIKSLLDKKNKKDEYRIYVFHDKLSEESKEKIKGVCRENFLEFVDVGKFLSDTTFPSDGHVNSVATFFRLFIAEILPEYDKILYLDCDILINGDIGKLFDCDLKNFILAGNKMLGDNAVERDYFNAGVLLFNVKEYLKNDICKKALKYIGDNEKIQYQDEQTLNDVCKGRVDYFSFKYNFQTWYCVSEDLLKKTGIKKIKDISIIHYSSKPWRDDTVPLGDLWWKKVDTLNDKLKNEIYEKYGRYSQNKHCYFNEYYFASPLKKLIYKIKKRRAKRQTDKIVRRKNEESSTDSFFD